MKTRMSIFKKVTLSYIKKQRKTKRLEVKLSTKKHDLTIRLSLLHKGSGEQGKETSIISEYCSNPSVLCLNLAETLTSVKESRDYG